MIDCLDSAICQIESLAKETKRFRYFRETKKNLISPVANQIQGAIFELLVLSNLIWLSNIKDLSIELYPMLPTGRRIEAKVLVNGHWCNFEAKALGYSQHDVGMKLDSNRVGSHGVKSMIKQITDALRDKAMQLSGAPHAEPTVVLLSLGYNAESYSAPWGIDDFFTSSRGEAISAVVLYGSFLCKKSPRIYLNHTARAPLVGSDTEILAAL